MAEGKGGTNWLQRLRLFSACILMIYVTMHLTNHAFGLISYETAEALRRSPFGFWHKEPFTQILALALLVHITTTLQGLYKRRSLRAPSWQILQLLLGITIPFFLFIHILATTGLQIVHDAQINYYFEFWLLWPGLARQQMILSLIVWLHGCIGIHFWLRTYEIYRKIQAWLLALAILLPTFSMLGFVSGGREIKAAIKADKSIFQGFKETYNWPKLSETIWVYDAERWLLGVFISALLLIVIVHIVRRVRAKSRGSIRVGYDGGKNVRVPLGASILEASRIGGIAHASVCGGRGRCSTCRIRVGHGGDQLPEAGLDEKRVLERLGAAPDIRLACQLRPLSDISVTLLMPAEAGSSDALRKMNPAQGMEREIVVLFADLRSFTQFSERRLPFDVVFVLNRYFKVMGEAIEANGGHLDKFIGDGIMALFGVGNHPSEAALQALAAAKQMGLALEALNSELSGDLPHAFRMGIGLHFGPAIIGEMGYGKAVSLTAIGDTVNVASRLEASSKEFGVELIVSDILLEQAGVKFETGEAKEIPVRGRKAAMNVTAFPKASALSLENEAKNLPSGMKSSIGRAMTWARSRMAPGQI